jgi:pimeloyl-ACP methyl ester carboxylesterase
MSSELATIVFLAGAFANPSCFDNVAVEFSKAGHPTVYASVQSLNPTDSSSVTTSEDANHVKKAFLIPLVEAGKDVVVFAHSYGGVVAGAAAAGLGKREGQGGVIGLLYLAGNIVGEGQSLKQAVGGAYPPFIKEDYVTSFHTI